MGAEYLKSSIVSVMQTVADFLSSPSSFTSAQATNLNTTLEALRGSIQALPIGAAHKYDLNSRLTAIQSIVSAYAAGTLGQTAFNALNALLSLLDLLKEKVEVLKVPTPIGLLTVDFTEPFIATGT